MKSVVKIEQPDRRDVMACIATWLMQALSATQRRHNLVRNHGADALIRQDFKQQTVWHPAVNDVD